MWSSRTVDTARVLQGGGGTVLSSTRPEEDRMTATTLRSPVDRFVAGIADPNAADPDAFAEDAVLDATTPGWRHTVRGRRGIAATFADWFADPATFETIDRTPIPGGELVEFTPAWTET